MKLVVILFQYLNIVELLESMERMTLASKYRKYRPDVPKKGNAKQWWVDAASFQTMLGACCEFPDYGGWML